MDGGAWQATVHGVTKGQTRLSDFTYTFHFPALEKEMATHSSVLAWFEVFVGGRRETLVSFLSSALCKASLDNHFALHLFFLDGFGHCLMYFCA